VYLGLFVNCIVLAWVNLAMLKIVTVCLPGWNAELTLAVVLGLVAIYSMLSGLIGLTVTDTFQFFLAVGGSIVLAAYAVPEAGGIAQIRAALPETAFRFMPLIGEEGATVTGVLSMTVSAFIAYTAVIWWASWYPGAEPGGGGYVVQRMASARDEKNSVFATLWFMIAHYCIRPWPWILTALAALVILPRLPAEHMQLATGDSVRSQAYRAALDPAAVPAPPRALAAEGADEFQRAFTEAKQHFTADPVFREGFENAVDPGAMFPKMMSRLLPSGVYGLLIAAFLAAYMSTISTQLNWGTSYLVNDFYRRFVAPQSSERHAVLVSRLLTLVVAALSLGVTRQLTAISDAWTFLLSISGGMGAVLILRWFWWRINASAEIAAMIAPIVPYLWCRARGIDFPDSLFAIVGFSTVAWLLVMYLTPPTDRPVLHRFYRRVHPGGPGWRRIAREVPEVSPDTGYAWLFVNWGLGCVLVYSILFGVGGLLLGNVLRGVGLLLIGILAGSIIWWDFGRQQWREPANESEAGSAARPA
jgi:solute:Na+ symporter, SSS family